VWQAGTARAPPGTLPADRWRYGLTSAVLAAPSESVPRPPPSPNLLRISADPTPGTEDMLFTRRMTAAAAVVGVELVDHLVLGAAGHWLWLCARGGW
jgi:hypothetical protein